MIDEYIEAMSEWISEEQRQRCRRLAEERYEAIRSTITHLYGQAFLDELEANVSGIISRKQLDNTIPCRLGFLRKQYRTRCKVVTSEQRLFEKAFNYLMYSKKLKKRSEKRAMNQMWRRSKARQRYNALTRIIAIDLGDDMAKELVWKSNALAIADLINKYKYHGVGMICGVCANDKSYELHHLRILYAYTRNQYENIHGSAIHNQINENYHNCMLDYYKTNK